MFCDRCGSQISDSATVCPICGAPQEAEAPFPGTPGPYTSAPAPAPAKSSAKKPILIALIALFLIGAGVLTYLGFAERKKGAEATASTTTPTTQEQPGGQTTPGQTTPGSSSGGTTETKPENAPTYGANQAFRIGDVSVTMENAYPWTKSSDFLSEGFRYVQIWVHMKNEGSASVPAPSYDSFFVRYDGDTPQWMKDYLFVYGSTSLKSEFGADNRTYLTGDPLEGSLSYETDYFHGARTIDAGQTLDVFLVYMVPQNAQNVTVLVYSSLASAKADETPLAAVTLTIDTTRTDPPDGEVIHYPDSVGTSRAMSTYKRPDNADFDGFITDFAYEDELLDIVKRNNGLLITDPVALGGGWIGQLDYTNDDLIRYFNAELQIAADGNATLTVDWFQSYDEVYKTYTDETMLANTTFTGQWDDSGSIVLKAPGVGELRFILFFDKDNYQYAMGRFKPSEMEDSAIEPSFNMIRPGWVLEPYLSKSQMDGYKSSVRYSDLAPAGWTQPGATGTWQPEPEPQNPSLNYGDITDCTLDDFSSWFVSYVNGNIPSNAEWITDPNEITGKWKCIIYYLLDDPSDPDYYVTVAKELNIAEIIINGSSATIRIQELRIHYEEEDQWYSEDITYDFNGTYYSDGTIEALSAGSSLDMYWIFSYAGHQYAIAELTLQSGEIAYMGLCRP